MASMKNIEKMTEVLKEDYPNIPTRPDWIRVDDPNSDDTKDLSGLLRELAFETGSMMIRHTSSPKGSPVRLEGLFDEMAERLDDAHEQYLNMALAFADPVSYSLGVISGTNEEMLP